MDPGAVALLALLELLYLRAVRVLRARGYRVSRLQQGLWHVGIGLQAASVIGPLETLDDQVLTIHMAQHLLLGDIAAPFLLAGLRTPLLQFFLPRSALVPLARRHG